MHDIVRQFNDISDRDLFQSWQDEVRLRNLLRTCAATNVAFSEVDHATVDFLYRSLYWHRRPDFFQVLFINMNNLAIYKWLNAKPDLTREFLTDLPYLILETRPDFRQLRFLINIYLNLYGLSMSLIFQFVKSCLSELPIRIYAPSCANGWIRCKSKAGLIMALKSVRVRNRLIPPFTETN